MATPKQTEGPFYPWRTPKEGDNDLVRVNGADAGAKGQVLEITGVVRSVAQDPLPGSMIEIWQCDAFGAYHHVSKMPRSDTGFQGYGKTVADEDGRYSFRTIKPVAYPGRTPHIHFKIIAPNGQTLTTQMYSQDEHTRNEEDGIYRSLSRAQRAAVTIVYQGTDVKINGEPVLRGTFDLVLPS